MDYIVSFPGLGIHELHIQREAVQVFGLSIYWYGIVIALGVLLGMYLALRHSRRYGFCQDDVLDCLIAAIPLAVICARIYYVIFSWDQYRNNLWSIFDTRSGGMAFYGGVIGAILGVCLVSRIKGISSLRCMDYLIVYIPLGQAIGRWGNFFNQEAFGTNTSLPWGMYSNGTRRYLASLNQPGLNPDLPVHPTFLYEFIGNLLIFAILLLIRRRQERRGVCLAWYLVLYGLLRFFVESIRTDALYIGHSRVPVSMLLSALMVLLGLAYLGFLWFQAIYRPERYAQAVKAYEEEGQELELRRLRREAGDSGAEQEREVQLESQQETAQVRQERESQQEAQAQEESGQTEGQDEPR